MLPTVFRASDSGDRVSAASESAPLTGLTARQLLIIGQDVAAYRTTEGGMTVWSSAGLIAGDMGKYVVDKFSRLMKNRGEKVVHKRAP